MNAVLTIYNRFDYVNAFFGSFFQSNLENLDKLTIFDDYSTEDSIVELLKGISNISEPEISIYRNPSNLGCDLNVFTAINHGFEETEDDFIMVLDSDALLKKEWLDVIIKQLEKVKNEKVGALSIFNTNNHLAIKDYDDELLEKHSLGGFCVALNRYIFNKMTDHNCWDWRFMDICKDENYKVLCTKISYAQHIGNYGVHSHGGGDKAINF